MTNYVLAISGSSAAPALSLNFTMSSPILAKQYAEKSSLIIASRAYYNFALFRYTEGLEVEHHLITSWEVRREPQIVHQKLEMEPSK